MAGQWTFFKQRVFSGLSNDFQIACVPTGNTDKKEILASLVDSDALVESDQVVSCVVQGNQLVEESVLILVHDAIVDWLLPEVKPTRRRLIVPKISIAHFNEQGQLSNVRFYWDQASVLRQISALPVSLYCKANATETVLPVVGARIVNVIQPVAFVEEPQVTTIVTAPESAIRQRAQRVAHGIVPQDDASEVRRTSLSRSTSYNSIIPQGDEPVPHPHVVEQKVANGIVPQGEEELSRPEPNPLRKKESMSNVFTDDQGRATGRPSTKVHQHPGGFSHNIFSSEPEPIKTSVPIDPRRFETQISLGATNDVDVKKVNRRDPNHSSFSIQEAKVYGRKVFSEKLNASQIDLASVSPAAEEYHYGRKMGKNTNESQFSFAGDDGEEFVRPKSAHRDHNAPSQPVFERPTSRVLRPPGGGSSLTIG